MLKVFIDTNILLDLLLCREPFDKDAQTIFWLAEEQKIELQISAISIINAAYVAHRLKFDDAQIRTALLDILDLVTIPNTDKRVVQNALLSEVSDFEDAAQVWCAKQGDADVIITRNVKDFMKSDVACVNPTDFLLAHSDML